MCPTLCDPTDGSPPGSHVPGILQARVLEWGAIAFFKKNIYFCFIDYPKPLTVWITTNCGKFLKMGMPDYLTYLLKNLFIHQEATVRTVRTVGTKEWFRERSMSRLYIVTLFI